MRRPRLRRPAHLETTSDAQPAGSPGLLARIRRGARSIAYSAQDVFFALLRIPRAIGRGAKGFWLGLSPRTRQRLALTLLAVAAAVAALALLVPRLPCQFPAGDVCAPADDSQQIIPADALAYLHLSLEEGSSQYDEATGTLDAVPELTRQAVGRILAQVPGPNGEPAEFARDIAPWLGGQAAVAIVPGGGAAEQVQLLEEGDPDGAQEFAESLAAGEPRTEAYRGIEIAVDARGLATASVGGFLAIGTDAGVKRLIDVETGAEGARPLADEEVATELRDELPPERFADAYISPDGMASLIASENSPLATLEPFVDSASSEGAAASFGAEDGTLQISVRSALDPERSKSDPSFFAAFGGFEPELPDRLAADALGYVGIGDPGTTVSELLVQATAEAPALAEGLAEAAERLRELGDVKLEDELLPALGGEAAFSLEPGEEPGPAPGSENQATAPAAVPEGLPDDPAPTLAGETPVPILTFLADGVDEERARKSLAQLQGPIAEALDTDTTLQAPVFDRDEYEGVDLEVLRISPTVVLTYALAGDSLAVATQPEGVKRVIDGKGGLNDTDGYERATQDFPDEPSMLAYLNLSGLIALGEREGLGEDPVYATFASEIRRFQAAGLAVEADSTNLATDLRIVVDQSDGKRTAGD